MKTYYRPLVQLGAARPEGAHTLAGGVHWFSCAEQLDRDGSKGLVAAKNIPAEHLSRLTAPRTPVAGLDMTKPQIMGILNVTPDSFSDGGNHNAPEAALSVAEAMIASGVDIIDIGGESTRPGADLIPEDEEIARIAPVVSALRERSDVVISIDTRKTAVARAAVGAGATMVNDVSGFTYDPALAGFCASAGLPVCVMHTKGNPDKMQANPQYDNVFLDVYDVLEEQIALAEMAGIDRNQIIVDPGIGFGKTQEHNLMLLRNLSLFHGLGCAILLGVSRKRFIGTIGNAPEVDQRAPGSIAVGLAALAQGVQILRVHDVQETIQAVCLWQAVR